MICGVVNKKADITIGVGRMQNRKKLCLVIQESNTLTKYGTFNNEKAAYEFMDKLIKLCEVREEECHTKKQLKD